eukprot:3331051-Rhodomonas_salina.2
MELCCPVLAKRMRASNRGVCAYRGRARPYLTLVAFICMAGGRELRDAGAYVARYRLRTAPDARRLRHEVHAIRTIRVAAPTTTRGIHGRFAGGTRCCAREHGTGCGAAVQQVVLLAVQCGVLTGLCWYCRALVFMLPYFRTHGGEGSEVLIKLLALYDGYWLPIVLRACYCACYCISCTDFCYAATSFPLRSPEGAQVRERAFCSIGCAVLRYSLGRHAVLRYSLGRCARGTEVRSGAGESRGDHDAEASQCRSSEARPGCAPPLRARYPVSATGLQHVHYRPTACPLWA